MNTVKQYSVVISGSFRRFYTEIKQKIREFNELGFLVLSPESSAIKGVNNGFTVLESDDSDSPESIEQKHLDAICSADSLYLCNPEGYVGLSSAVELGWALGQGKPVFVETALSDEAMRHFTHEVGCPSGVLEFLIHRDEKYFNRLNRHLSLDQLQKYVAKVVIRRGFDAESSRDIFHLLVEEIGELAKALRWESGLKVDANKQFNKSSIDEELADIFIYVVHLSNNLGINLFAALLDKERSNEERVWRSKRT